MVEPKDVVLAVLGGSVGLGGFVLVFLGIVISSYQGFTGGVPESVIRPYRTTGAALLATFGFSLLTAAVSLLWLVGGGPAGLYGWTVGLFVVQLAAVFASAGWATRMALWR